MKCREIEHSKNRDDNKQKVDNTWKLIKPDCKINKGYKILMKM